MPPRGDMAALFRGDTGLRGGDGNNRRPPGGDRDLPLNIPGGEGPRIGLLPLGNIRGGDLSLGYPIIGGGLILLGGRIILRGGITSAVSLGRLHLKQAFL